MTQLEQDINLIDSRIKLKQIEILELEAEVANLSQSLQDFNRNKLHGKCFKPFANSTHYYKIAKVVSISGTDTYCEVLSVSPSFILTKHTYLGEDAVEITAEEFNTRMAKYGADLIQKRKQLESNGTKIESNLLTKFLTSWYKKLINLLNK